MPNQQRRPVGASFDTTPQPVADLGGALRPAVARLLQATGGSSAAAGQMVDAASRMASAQVQAAQAHAALSDQLAQGLSHISARVGQWADEAAAKEGAAAGEQAGLDPEFRAKNDLTIFGEAYDRAGLETYKSQLSLSLEEQLAKAEDAHGDDPQKLGAVMDTIRDKTLPGLPQELRIGAATVIERRKLGAMREASRRVAIRRDAEQRTALSAEIDVRAQSLERQAYKLGLDPTADKVLAEDLADLKGRLEVVGVDGQVIVQPDLAASALRSAGARVEAARIRGAFDRLPTIEAKRAFVSDLDSRVEAGEAGGVLSAGELNGLTNGLAEEIDRLEADKEQGLEKGVLDGIEAVPDEEMEKRLDTIEPAEDDPDFAMKSRVYGRAADRVAQVRKLRLTDPARSVTDNAQVAAARQARVTGDPKSEQTYVATVMKAQIDAGITVPEALPRLEARQLFSSVAYADPQEVPAKMEALGRYVFRTYGDLAPQVMLDVLRAGSGDETVAKAAAPIMAIMASGGSPTAGSIDRFRKATDIAAMTPGILPRRAIGRAGSMPLPGSQQPVKPFKKRKASFAAMHELIRAPELADAFDEEYGQGSAAHVLGLAQEPWQQELSAPPPDPGLAIDAPTDGEMP